MLSFTRDIGIDLGSANILIYVRGKGIVVNEPSVVVVEDSTKKVIAVGHEAKKIIGRTPGNIRAIRPLKDGVIADFDLTEELLRYFIDKLNIKGFFIKTRILICCPTNITEIEKKAICQVAEKLGGNLVLVEEEPKVAAIGSGLNIFQPFGTMIIDIGGGTTDIAVLSTGDIVTSSSIRIAGNKFDADIISYVKDKYKLLIGDRTAEDLKINVVTVHQSAQNKTMEVCGRDMISGLPGTINISSLELFKSLSNSIEAIVREARLILEKTPPELVSDIIDRGVVLTGGGALIEGLPKLLSQHLGIPMFLANNPKDCVALGTGILLENLFEK